VVYKNDFHEHDEFINFLLNHNNLRHNDLNHNPNNLNHHLNYINNHPSYFTHNRYDPYIYNLNSVNFRD